MSRPVRNLAGKYRRMGERERRARADVPLLVQVPQSARSMAVSRGNRTRRLNQMRRAREFMQAALSAETVVW